VVTDATRTRIASSAPSTVISPLPYSANASKLRL
jgi:hypothetical protein